MPLEDLLKRIETAGPASLTLDASQMISTQDAEVISAALENNKAVSSVHLGDIRLTPSAAAVLFEAYILSSRIHKLRMPLWSVVYHSSQRPIMLLEEELPAAVESYNAAQRRNLFSYNLFVRLNEKTFKCVRTAPIDEASREADVGKATKRRKTEIVTYYYIPEATLQEYLKPFLVGPKKSLSI